mmetsp:Transcript_17222/g.69296  ORF Transcript_17222/g.69296 Transcript_17222/m.69296 type:complete len:217 (+) Transcript_17222:247-897(+)
MTGISMHLSRPPSSLYHVSSHVSASSSIMSRCRMTFIGALDASTTGWPTNRSAPGAVATRMNSRFSRSIEHLVMRMRASHDPFSLRMKSDVASPSTSRSPAGAGCRGCSLNHSRSSIGTSVPHLGSPFMCCRNISTEKKTSLNGKSGTCPWKLSESGPPALPLLLTSMTGACRERGKFEAHPRASPSSLGGGGSSPRLGDDVFSGRAWCLGGTPAA